MTNNIWHYARSSLATDTLTRLFRGPSEVQAVHAPPRTGKTEFLLHDIAPVARAAGHQVAYVDLARHYRNLEQAITAALLSRVELPGARAGLAARYSLGAVAPVLKRLSASQLLLLDGAHALARPDAPSLPDALRPLLEGNAPNVRVLCAGQSEPVMRRVFDGAEEPLYRSLELGALPMLGTDFVNAMVARTNDLTRYPLEPARAAEAFDELRKNPKYFRLFLDRYLTHASEGSAAALEATKEVVFSSRRREEMWESLHRADRCVLQALAAGETDLYSLRSRAWFAQALGATDVSKSTIQNAVTRLALAAHVLTTGRGQYEIADDEFAEWVRAQAGSPATSEQRGQHG